MDRDSLMAELDGRMASRPAAEAEACGVTLLCCDCVNPQLAAFALDVSRRGCRFDRVVLLSHQFPEVLPDGIDFQPISRLASKDAYNLFVLKELHRYVTTPWVLSVQTDGFLMRPEKISEEFFLWDYNGAVWPANKPYAIKSRVGNSGCCIRSLDLLEWTAKLATDRKLDAHRRHYGQVFDDLFCGWDAYDDLVAIGMTFAPPDTASRFSIELPTEYGQYLGSCVGFHGAWHYPTTWLRERLGVWMQGVK